MDDTQLNETESSTMPIDVYSTSWDRNSENTPVYAIASAVAELTDSDHLELPPLYEAIDPDALNALFASDSSTSESRVRFEYAGHTVTVHGSGEVHIRPAHEA